MDALCSFAARRRRVQPSPRSIRQHSAGCANSQQKDLARWNQGVMIYGANWGDSEYQSGRVARSGHIIGSWKAHGLLPPVDQSRLGGSRSIFCTQWVSDFWIALQRMARDRGDL